MLLAGGERQHEAALARRVHRLAAQPPGHLAHIFLLAREQAEIGPAELEADAERLAFAHDDVRAHRARRFDRAQRDRLGHHRDQQRAGRMRGVRQGGKIFNSAENIGILDNNAARVLVDRRDQLATVAFAVQFRRRISKLVAGELRHRLRDRDIMGMQARRQNRLAPLGDAPRHADRFPAGGRPVIHGGVGDVAAQQPRDLRLEFEQHLQRALRDFGLVRRIGGQELAALDQMIDAGGNMMLVGARPQEEGRFPRRQILARQRGHVPLDRHLAGMVGKARDGAGQPGFGGHVDEQVVDGSGPDGGEHRLPVAVGKG